MRAWESFLTKQEDQLGQQIVKKWLTPLRVVKFDAGNLYLEAQNHFQALWFEEHIRRKAEVELLSANQRQVKIHLNIANDVPKQKKSKRKFQKNGSDSQPFQFRFDEIDPFCTFDTFIASDSNLVPYRLMQEIISHQTQSEAGEFSEKEMITFNPVYVYGLSGTGKTHLLMATAKSLKESGLNVIYVRAQTFTDHVVRAIRAGEMSVFRQTYRQADVLIIDDVHVFSRKGATQEEFFHTFNTLHLAGKQIILSAGCVPQELQHIEPRLISRFEWGIVLPMSPLDRTQIKKLLSNKIEALKFPLDKKTADFLLDTFNSNPKSVTRALEALVLRSHMKGNEGQLSNQMSVHEAKHALKDLIEEERKSEITSEKINFTVSEQYGVNSEDLTGDSQKKDYVLPRQVAMYLHRDKLNLSYKKIGDLFDRDHSTVMSSVKRVDKELKSGNHELVASLNAIKNRLIS